MSRVHFLTDGSDSRQREVVVRTTHASQTVDIELAFDFEVRITLLQSPRGLKYVRRFVEMGAELVEDDCAEHMLRGI